MKIKNTLFFLLLFLLASQILFGQDTRRKLSITQLIDEINATTTGTTYRLTNAEISPVDGDPILGTLTNSINNIKNTYTEYGLENIKDKSLSFKNCKFIFPEDSRFAIYTSIFYSLRFQNCEFSTGLRLWRCEFVMHPRGSSTSINIDSTLFKGSFIFWLEAETKSEALTYMRISNCEFNQYVVIRGDVKQIRINNSDFTIKTIPNEYKGNSLNQLTIERSHHDEIRIWNCTFNSNGFENVHSIAIESTIGTISLSKNIIESIDFRGSTISKSISINSEIKTDFGVELFDFPFVNTNIPWRVIAGEKFSLDLKYSNSFKKHPPYKAKTEEQLSNENSYNDLIAAYKKFHSMYLTRGDMRSANACYVEMKNIETRRNKYLNKVDPSLENYLNYNLNVFLRFFSAYGTSPVRSLIVSLYVVLIFASFYFFFYSEWDKIDRRYLMKKHKILVEYLRSEQSLEDFYTQEYKEDFQSFEDFKNYVKDAKKSIPFFVDTLGQPLYRLSKLKHNLMSWLYRRTEILQGRWTDLNSRRKLIIGSTLFTGIMFYLVYILLLRVLNSVVLSLNTFSTLGFGDIPVKGISRYLAIIEGFIGWFLLTLFSVSLISQILQS